MKTFLRVAAIAGCGLFCQAIAQNPFYEQPRLHSIQASGLDLRTSDLDGDGNVDVVSVSTLGIEILLGDGTGQFLPPVRLPSLRNVLLDFTVGDFNGDGTQDFVTFGRSFTSPRGFLDLYLSTGARDWSPPFLAIRLNSFKKTALTALDANGDGLLDLAVVRGISLRSYVNRGNGVFKAQPALGASGTEIVVADLNQDFISDLIVSNEGKLRAFYGRGNGRFRKGPALNAARSAEAAFGDMNNDGLTDVVSLRHHKSRPESLIYVTLAKSKERYFAERLVAEQGTANSLHLADISGDGLPDLTAIVDIFTPTQVAVNVSFNLGNGLQYLFSSGAGVTRGRDRPFVLYVRDVNFDSLEDLLLVDLEGSAASVILQSQSRVGLFEQTVTSVPFGSGSVDPDHILWADFNGDSRDDMLLRGRRTNFNIHVLLAKDPPEPPEWPRTVIPHLPRSGEGLRATMEQPAR